MAYRMARSCRGGAGYSCFFISIASRYFSRQESCLNNLVIQQARGPISWQLKLLNVNIIMGRLF